MTDLLTTGANLRAEGEELRTEIDRHAEAMYVRLSKHQQRLIAELHQTEALMRRFEWVAPQNHQLAAPPQGQRIRAVEANKGNAGG